MRNLLVVFILCGHLTAYAEDSRILDADCFWPPDMVPHPHPPQPEPKDDMA